MPFKCEYCNTDDEERKQIEHESGKTLDDPSLREQWGCEFSTQLPVWEDEDEREQYYNCPVRFISDAVIDWYAEHSYYELYTGSAPGYDAIPAKFLDAVNFYKSKYNLYIKVKHKQPDKTTEGLNILKQAHYNG